MTQSEKVDYLQRRSIEIIREGQHPSGAYFAAPTFGPYQYSWFRDGSFIADSMSRMGEIESAEAFFAWASRVIVSRKDAIDSGAILHTRYTVDGEESSEEWSNFQLDGFGTYVWALYEHARRHNRPIEEWRESVDTVVRYLDSRWREHSHDWWEEYAAIHPATLAPIHAAFMLTGHPEAHAVKNAIDLTGRLDASMIACATPFDAISADEFAPVLSEIETKLVTPKGGVHRHENDEYYGGGEWVLLTAFLGWHYVRIGRMSEAQEKLERIVSMMDDDGRLPEQSSEYMLNPDSYEPWVKKWGSPAHPLLWSHAMFLTLAHELAT